MKTCNAKSFKTNYKNVYEIHQYGKIRYRAQMSRGVSKLYDDIREAAKAIDIWFIRNGKDPVNILVRK